MITYQQNHGTFPTDSTLQQLYDDQEFEAYRALGYHCAQAALRNFSYDPGRPPADGAAAAAGPVPELVPAQASPSAAG